MRYVKIFLIHMEDVLESRSRAFVWFLTTIFSPLILILFWKGAAGNKILAPGWDFAAIASYYFLSTLVFSLLMSHIEEEISRDDIKEGLLVMYLLRPFSYYWEKFLTEIPYRFLQALYAIVFCLLFFALFGTKVFSIHTDPVKLFLTGIIFIFAFFLSFTWKMIMGISTFWFTDTRGFYEAMYAIEFAIGGTLIPLILLPSAISSIAYVLPFSYIIYFPTVALEGKLGIPDLFRVILIQIIWLVIIRLLYHLLWLIGIKKFSGVGQ